MKRMLDLIIAVSALIILSPILGIALILIGLESGFPLFYIQARTGYLGKPYSMIKLRTMKDGAEGDGAQWAKKKDSRVTKIGKFLRNWRVDEIPQFWNIIMGQMSVVGPRPERPEFQADLKDKVPFWYARNLVKPGLTGWAQIRFSYASDLSESEEKLSYDLYYLKHASFALDMEIILSTLRSVSKGSR
jgi:lipopolysaccharide/colanic/teichoic acid biosynthesis glycosyltransferase